MKFNIPPKAQYHQKWKPIETDYDAEVKANTEAATELFLRQVGNALRRHLRSRDAHLHFLEFNNIPTEVSFSAAKDQLEKLGYSVHDKWSARQITIYFN